MMVVPVTILLLFIIHLITSFFTIYSFKTRLLKNSDHIRIENVRYDFFSSDASIKALIAESINVGNIRWCPLTVNISSNPFFKKALTIRDLHLKNTTIEIVNTARGDISIEGIILEKSMIKSISSFPELINIDLENVTVNYRNKSFVQSFTITKAFINPFSSSNLIPGNFNFHLNVGGGSISVSGQSHKEKGNHVYDVVIRANSVSLGSLAPPVKLYGISAFDAVISGVSHLKGTIQSKASFKIASEDSIEIKNMKLLSSGFDLNHAVTGFKGSVQVEKLPNLKGIAIYTNGTTGVRNASLGFPKKNLVGDFGNTSFIGIAQYKTGTGFISQGDLSFSDWVVRDTAHRIIALNLENGLISKINSISPSHSGANYIILNKTGLLKSYSHQKNNADKYVAYTKKMVLISPELINRDSVFMSGMDIYSTDLYIQRNIDCTLEIKNLFRTLFPQPKTSQQDTSQQDTSQQQKNQKPSRNILPVAVKINRMEMRDSSTLSYVDRSIKPAANLTVNFLNTTADEIILDKTVHVSRYKLTGCASLYSSVSAHGSADRLTAPISAAAYGSLKRFSLPSITGYIQNLIGYRVKSGRLNSVFDVKIDKGSLDATVGLTIREINMVPQKSTEAYKKFSSQLPISLNKGLDLLTNDKGDAHFTISVSGNLQDPNIHWGGVIETAIANSIKGAFKDMFSFLAYVFSFGTIDNNPTVMQLRAVQFSPGSSELSPKAKAYLDSVLDKAAQYPNARILICGKAASKDAEQMFGADVLKNGKKLDKREQERLLNLARERSKAIKAYIAKKHKINITRVYLCAPAIDLGSDSTPRADLNVG